MKVDWTLEESDLDAILTEAELIRIHQPKFNIQLKDDKSPLYIFITNEKFPRVLTLRKTQLPDNPGKKTVFGPYPSSYQTKKVLRIARKAFPFCNTRKNKKQKKACFYSHLSLCPGACTGQVTRSQYAQNINNLKLFLSGKKKSVIKKIESQMKKQAQQLKFEKAAKLREQLKTIQTFSQVPASINWLDTSQSHKLQNVKSRLLLYKTISPFIIKKDKYPPENPFSRIESYDISNLQGKHATGSMIVFINGLPLPSQYRRFRIRWIDEPNDTVMLSEVVYRRFKHRNWPNPELIIVDGGKAQVRAVKRSLASYGLHHKIPVIGIAKQSENLIFHKNVFHVLKLSKRSPALKLVMHLRDEAHRFAKNYHILLRQKSLTQETNVLNT